MPRTVHVPFERLRGWVERFDAAHPGATWSVSAHEVTADGPDGTSVCIGVPVRPLESSPPTMVDLYAHVLRPWRMGVVLVRRGGFAVASVYGGDVVASKVGRRHVQGRTKAGGWSQQRFARRRDNQARAAFDAAAEHAVGVLSTDASRLDLVALGGDRRAVITVLEQLPELTDIPRVWLGGVADPSRDVLVAAIARARSVVVQINDPETKGAPHE